MEIQIDAHTLERAEERGATEEEIRDTVRSGEAASAKRGRLSRFKIYPFGRTRLGRFYAQKRVEVIYTEEQGNIVTVTVYVFYGEWDLT